MIKITTLLFDFDGTLADTRVILKDILNGLAEEFHYPKIGDGDIEALRNRSMKEFIKDFGIPFYKIPFFIRRVREKMALEIHRFKPIKGMIEALKDLDKRGYRIGIVTTNAAENIRIFLNNNNLTFFDYLYGDGSLFGKHVKIIKLLRDHQLQKSEVVYFGDEVRDIEAAGKAGVKIASVLWGYNDEEILSKYRPDWIFHKPGEILEEFL